MPRTLTILMLMILVIALSTATASPAWTAGWFATIPTGLPPSRANPTTMFCAKCSWTSRKQPSSAMALTAILMS